MDIQSAEGVNSPCIKLINFQEILNKKWVCQARHRESPETEALNLKIEVVPYGQYGVFSEPRRRRP